MVYKSVAKGHKVHPKKIHVKTKRGNKAKKV